MALAVDPVASSNSDLSQASTFTMASSSFLMAMASSSFRSEFPLAKDWSFDGFFWWVHLMGSFEKKKKKMKKMKKMMKKKTMMVLEWCFVVRIWDEEEDEEKMMKKKKNANFQKGHKLFRDFQIAPKLLRGKIVHLVKVKGCLTLTNQTLTFVSNLQKKGKLHRGYLEFKKFCVLFAKEVNF